MSSGDEHSRWGKRSFVLVTGASKGIGRGLAVELSKRVGAQGSVLVLMARSQQGLEVTKQQVLSAAPSVSVLLEVMDLSQPDLSKMEDLFERVPWGGKKKQEGGFESYMLVHNAGSEGSGVLVTEMADLKEWQDYMALNLYSMAMLTTAFLKWVDQSAHRFILNTTSLAAVQPIPGLGFYCVGKCAREMYLKTLAAENPSLDVLNYSPGPVRTEMVDRVIEKTKNEGTKRSFAGMREEGKLVRVEETVAKLMKVLSTPRSYVSGGRIDYYDA